MRAEERLGRLIEEEIRLSFDGNYAGVVRAEILDRIWEEGFFLRPAQAEAPLFAQFMDGSVMSPVQLVAYWIALAVDSPPLMRETLLRCARQLEGSLVGFPEAGDG